MAVTITSKKGVKFIKLNKFDTGSTNDDLTTPLGEISKIRINYSDKGIVEYPINSIVEHDTYYLYRIATTNATSSADNKQLDYNFLGHKTTNQTFELGKTGISSYNASNTIDSLGYFNESSGLYTYGDTPNKTLRLEFTASLNLAGSGVENVASGSVNLRQAGVGNIATVSFSTSSGGTDTDFIVEGVGPVFRPIETQAYNFRLFLDSTSSDHPSDPVTLTLNDFKYKLLTGSAYTTSEGAQLPVVIEPFFSKPFFGGDFNAIIGNAQRARSSKLFFDVDYSENLQIPVNQESLIDSTQRGNLSAPFARIQDYNYYLDRSLIPRYKGTKSTSPGFNLSSSEGGLGTLPNVEQLNVAAYSINWAGGTSPEILDAGGTSLSDILLVGDTRDDITIIPQADPNYSDIINSSVEPGDIVSFYQYGNSSAQAPQRVEVIETKLNVPPKSAYMIPKTLPDSLTVVGSGAIFDSDVSGSAGTSGSNAIVFKSGSYEGYGVFTVGTNSEGFYITGSHISGSDFIDEFAPRFNNSKNDFYVSIYKQLSNPVIYDGAEATRAHNFIKDFTPSDPLGFYGVAKIIGVNNDGKGGWLLLDRDISSIDGLKIGAGNVGGANKKGLLIWESWGNSIIVRGSTLSGVGASLVYSEFAPKTLTENLGYISTNYG